MIIDSHVHYGKSAWGNFTPEYLLNLVSDEVEYVVCSNLEGIESVDFKEEFECNLEMLNFSKKYSKIKPLAVCQPNKTQNADNMRKFLSIHKQFIGLKFHPECMRLPATDKRYDSYLNLARDLNLPCLFHSGHIKSRFSSPALIYEKAQEFPNVPIILGHLSTGPKSCHIRTIEILIESIEKENATLYVDTSWIDFLNEELDETYADTIMLIKSLKNTSKGDYTRRILWATDCPVGRFNQTKESYKRNINIFKKRILEEFNDEKLLENILYTNAMKLYGFDEPF